MNTTKTVKLLPYTVTLRDGRTGEITTDTIVLDKDAVRLCQSYGMDGPALLHRVYNARGYRVLDVTGHRCKAVSVDLLELYQRTTEDRSGND